MKFISKVQQVAVRVFSKKNRRPVFHTRTNTSAIYDIKRVGVKTRIIPVLYKPRVIKLNGHALTVRKAKEFVTTNYAAQQVLA